MPLHGVWEYRDIGRLFITVGGESDNRGAEVGAGCDFGAVWRSFSTISCDRLKRGEVGGGSASGLRVSPLNKQKT